MKKILNFQYLKLNRMNSRRWWQCMLKTSKKCYRHPKQILYLLKPLAIKLRKFPKLMVLNILSHPGNISFNFIALWHTYGMKKQVPKKVMRSAVTYGTIVVTYGTVSAKVPSLINEYTPQRWVLIHQLVISIHSGSSILFMNDFFQIPCRRG